MRIILLGVLVLVTVGVVAWVVVGYGESGLAGGVVLVTAALAVATVLLALRTLDLMPRSRSRRNEGSEVGAADR